MPTAVELPVETTVPVEDTVPVPSEATEPVPDTEPLEGPPPVEVPAPVEVAPPVDGTATDPTGGPVAGLSAQGVSGTVTETGSGEPVAGAFLAVLRASDFSLAAGAVADASGDYSVSVGAASYFIYAVDPTGDHTAGFFGAPTMVTVTAGATVAADPTMVSTRGSITATVTDTDTGDPIPGVWGLALSGAMNTTGAPETAVVADASGQLTLPGLRAGNHFVGYVDPTGAHTTRFFPNSPNVPDATLVAVTAAGTTEANASLPAQTPVGTGATITGTVTEQDTTALPDARVVALRASDYTMVRGAVTNTSGQYRLDVVPGDYKLAILDGAGLHDMEWFDNQPSTGLGDAATVTAPGTANATLSPNTGTMTGTITDESSGDPIADAWVLAIGPTGIAGGTVTATDGTYTITGLTPGTYRAAIVDPNGGRTMEYYDNSTTFDNATPITITTNTTTINATLSYPPPAAHCGPVTTNETWGPGVHQITCPVQIADGGSVVLAAGAVVKIQNGQNGFVVSPGGTLEANGTAADPVTVTSVADDSVGGDTNGDGTSTSPESGRYGTAVAIDGKGSSARATAIASVTLNNLAVRYGQTGMSQTSGCDAGRCDMGVARDGRVKVTHAIFSHMTNGLNLDPTQWYWTSAESQIGALGVEDTTFTEIADAAIRTTRVASVLVRSSEFHTPGAALRLDSADFAVIESSLFDSDSERGPSAEFYPTTPPAVSLSDCGGGEVSANTFDHVALGLGYCNVSVSDNFFANASDPLWVSNHDDLELVDLAGPGTNTFTGTGDQRAVHIDASSVPSGTTWVVDDTGGAIVIPNGISVRGVAQVEAGVILKVPVGDFIRGLMVYAGGNVTLAGTASEPVVTTLDVDDTVGGDTNGDGTNTTPATVFRGWEILVAFHGGSLTVDHSEFRWLSLPITSTGGAENLTITDSRFVMPATRSGQGPLQGSVVSQGAVTTSGCSDGEVSGNTFDHVALSLSNCAVARVSSNSFDNGALGLNGGAVRVSDNFFANASDPLWVSNHDDLELVDLAGPGTNTFTGTGDQRAVHIDASSVPSGTTWVVDDTGGAIVIPNGISVRGVAQVEAGVILKVPVGDFIRGLMVYAGGNVTLAGTASEPVVTTLDVDDTVGGDTNGDGTNTTPATVFRGWEILVAFHGGSLTVDHSEFRWLSYPITHQGLAETVTITDSRFVMPATRSGQGPLQGSVVSQGAVTTSGCSDGEVSGNTFDHVALSVTGCPVAISDNAFVNTANPLSVGTYSDIGLVDLAGPETNTFSGTGIERAVSIYHGNIPDGTTWVYDRESSGAVLVIQAPISSSHGLNSANGSVRILPGGIVKGGPTAMFDLGPRSHFDVEGTQADPVVFTSIDDDTVGGDTDGDGSASQNERLSAIFRSDQGGVWEFIGGIGGVDLDRVGPGHANVNHAVVRRTDTAFAGCIICDVQVNNTDFIDVTMGVSQSYYVMPVVPCAPLMGSADGGPPFWNTADATGNYWGAEYGPSISVNPVEIALQASSVRSQANALRDGLIPAEQSLVDEALQNLFEHYGGEVLGFPLGGSAQINVGVHGCLIPVVNLSFPVIINPVDTGGWTSAPIHSQPAGGW